MIFRFPHLSVQHRWIKGAKGSAPCRPEQGVLLSDAPGGRGRKELRGRSLHGFGRGFAVKLILGGATFLLLTIGVFVYQFGRVQSTHDPLGWHQLQWKYFPLIILCFPLETLASGLRVWVVSRVLDRGLSFWTCIKSELANLGFAVVTPSQTGGGFGQIYILCRGGANPGTAFTISVVSFIGTMLGMPSIGLYILLTPGAGYTGPVLHGAFWTFTLISGCMVLGATWPGLFVRIIFGLSHAASLAGRITNRLRTATRFVNADGEYRARRSCSLLQSPMEESYHVPARNSRVSFPGVDPGPRRPPSGFKVNHKER